MPARWRTGIGGRAAGAFGAYAAQVALSGPLAPIVGVVAVDVVAGIWDLGYASWILQQIGVVKAGGQGSAAMAASPATGSLAGPEWVRLLGCFGRAAHLARYGTSLSPRLHVAQYHRTARDPGGATV